MSLIRRAAPHGHISRFNSRQKEDVHNTCSDQGAVGIDCRAGHCPGGSEVATGRSTNCRSPPQLQAVPVLELLAQR